MRSLGRRAFCLCFCFGLMFCLGASGPLPWAAAADPGAATAAPAHLAAAPDTPRPFSTISGQVVLAVAAGLLLLGLVRGLLPASWRRGPFAWLRAVFEHTIRIGWLAFVPALVLDGLIFFEGGRYSHAWSIGVLTFALAPFAAGLQWEKAWWNARRNREEPYPTAFNYYVGVALAALLPALAIDWILSLFAREGRLPELAMPFNLLALAAVAGTAGFAAAKVLKLAGRILLRPHRAVLFFIDPASRFYAVILALSLAGMSVFNYFTIPFFIEVIAYTQGPVPAINADQALIILLPNIINVVCVTYFSIFAGVFMSMLPLILFSRTLRKKPPVPPRLDVLLKDPALSREYLGRELREEEILPTIVTITAYNEPADPLEKTVYGYLKIAKRWVELGLPRDRYLILLSHQTEREEERLEFEAFLRERFPDADPRNLITRDWAAFDEDRPTDSIRDESRLFEVLHGWLEHRKLDPESKPGRAELQKRRVCQRMYEFSCHAPRELCGLPDLPARQYGPRPVEGWIWYYLIPKNVGGRLLQVTSKAHNLYYAREGIWGKADSSPLSRDGLYHEWSEWLFDASDADSEIHETCVDGIIASYSPFYREPGLGWLQRLSYTIEPGATFLSAVKSASETAYWSWYLRARVHTYMRKGRPLMRRVGDSVKPLRRDFQAANGHNMVVRGSSIKAAGGDLEHEQAMVYDIESPLKRWIARLRGKPDPGREQVIEKWVPTGEDLELATRMSLEGYYGDYAVYAPQGEGSPADFRGNVPQAIRWSGNNVQLIAMHLARVFGSARLTFNEKMGYFVNLATLASAPLLYLSVLRAGVMPFLEIPDAYSRIHAGFGPFAFILALAPNFLLLALALAGQLVVKNVEPWQRSVLKPWHQRLLQWIGYFLVPPLTILAAAFLPGWLKAVGVPLPDEMTWILVLDAVLFNLILLIFKRQAFASLAYCVVLLPFLQVLYLAWIIFGIVGCINMLIKTQIVEPYLSRLCGTFHPPVASRYPSDKDGRFLAMNQRFPGLFTPLGWARRHHRVVAVLFAALAALLLWMFPLPGWGAPASAAVGFLVLCGWLWLKLPGLLSDWFLDRDSLINRWWDYWTNPQAAFVKTIKERQERSLSTLLKDNVYGIVNGIVIIGLILHVHFVNAGDFSTALLAYLTFSIGASWIVSPFFYEEPHRTIRSQGKAVLIAVVLVAALFVVPVALERGLNRFFAAQAVRPEHLPWLYGLLGAITLAGVVNAAPWPAFRSFAKRFALAFIMLGLLFLNAIAVSYRGVSVEPLEESQALEADGAVVREVRHAEELRERLGDVRERLAREEETAVLALLSERLSAEAREEAAAKAAEARAGARDAAEKAALAARRVEEELARAQPMPLQPIEKSSAEKSTAEKSTAHSGSAPRGAEAPDLAPAVIEALLTRGQTERERLREDYRKALEVLGDHRRKEAAAAGDEARQTLHRRTLSHEEEIVEPLRRHIEEVDEHLEGLAAARADPGASAAGIEILPIGDLSLAEAARDGAARKLAEANSYHARLEGEEAAAADSLQAARAAREQAWQRVERLREEQANLANRQPDTARLEFQAKRRARLAFLARPDRYDRFQKNLGALRPVLEDPATRKNVADALRAIAAQHWSKRVVLEGAGWFPKEGLIARVDLRVPEQMDRLLQAIETADQSRRGVELRIARRSLAISADLCRRLVNAQAFTAEELGLTALEGAASSSEPETAALQPARAALRRLEAAAPALDRAPADGSRARLARAGLESFLSLTARLAREAAADEELRKWLALRLEPRHVESLMSERMDRKRREISEQLARLVAWRGAFQPERDQAADIFRLFSMTPAAEASPFPDAAGVDGGPLAFAEGSEILSPLVQAIKDHQRARDHERRLALLEEEVLAEIDRLEPHLVGQPASLDAAPPPFFLVRRELAALRSRLDEAREVLFQRLDKEVLAHESQSAREGRPERDRLRGELLEDLRAARDWAFGLAKSARAGVSWRSLLRIAYGWKIQTTIAALDELYGRGRPGAPGGLLEDLERARSEAGEAQLSADRQPGDLLRQNVASLLGNGAKTAEAKAAAAWTRLRQALAGAEAMEELLWEGAWTAASGERLEDYGRDARQAIERCITPLVLKVEKLQRLEEEVGQAKAGPEAPVDLAALLAAPDLAELEKDPDSSRVSALRKEVEALSRGPAPPPASPSPAVSSGGPAGPTPGATLPPLELEEALAEAAVYARQPGGPVFIAEKEIEAALEEWKISGRRLYPELFGSLGANSTAPAIFQGGGFGLVTLSLDQFQNREIFRRESERRDYLRALAELTRALRTVRAYAGVVAAERQAARLEARSREILAAIDAVRGRPGAERGGEVWLDLERARLEGDRAEANAKLAARKRALNAELGRPPGQPLSVGFNGELTLSRENEVLEAWLRRTGAAIEERFPRHPAFQVARAALERHAAEEEEARLKRTWPVFRAGAGVVAPSPGPFSVGASVIVPVLDRSSALDQEKAAVERRLILSEEDERAARERLRREVARSRHARAAQDLASIEELLALRRRSLHEAVDDYQHGFEASPSRVGDEAARLRRGLLGAAATLDSFLESGLDLAETGAMQARPDSSEAAASRPPVIDLAREPIRRQRERISLAESRCEREAHLLDRVGLGASASYSSLFLPFPAIEVVYGSSILRREAAAAGREFERRRLELAEAQARRDLLDSELARRRDRAAARALEGVLEIRRRQLDAAARAVRQGLEPPLTEDLARSSLREAERELEEARRQAEETEALHRGGADTAGAPALPEGLDLTPESIDRDLAPGAAAMPPPAEAALRAAKAAEVEYRYRLMVAAIENKKPYGGNVGNFLAPIWDLVRLWRRPAPPEEQEARLAELRQAIQYLESASGPPERTARAYETALRAAKSALGGDGYELEEVEKAVRDWRVAAVGLEHLDREAARRRRQAELAYASSRERLERLEEEARSLLAQREALSASAAAGGVRSSRLRGDDVELRMIEIAGDLERLEAARAGALWRYARARLAQADFGGPLLSREPPPGPPSRPPGTLDELARRPVTLDDLARAYVRADAETAASRAVIASRARERNLSAKLRRLRASLPTVMPSLAVDPRFGGSGLTSSMSVGHDTARAEYAEAVPRELVALEADVSARETEAALQAVRDAVDLRLARERALALEIEVAARRTKLERMRAAAGAGEAAPVEVRDAERALAEALREESRARWELWEAEAKIDLRAGEPVALEFPPPGRQPGGQPAESEAGAAESEAGPAELTAEIRGAWKSLARERDPLAKAAAEREEEARIRAKWQRRDDWLSTRLELIASLGQTPETVDVGGGGFFALPILRYLGLGPNRARVEEIRAEIQGGSKVRRMREAGDRVEELALRASEAAEVAARRAAEVEIAREAYERESRLLETGRKPLDAAQAASRRYLDSLEDAWQAEAGLTAAREELSRRLAAAGAAGSKLPLIVPRRNPDQPGARPAAGAETPEERLAREMAAELTALPAGTAYDLEENTLRLERLAADEERARKLTAREALAELGLAGGLEALAGALERSGGAADHAKLIADLRARLERGRQALLGLSRAHTVAERAAALSQTRDADLGAEPAAGALAPVLELPGIETELRAALARELASRRRGLEEERARLEKSGPDGEAPRPAALRFEDLGLDGLLQRPDLAGARDPMIAKGLESTAAAFAEARRARQLDALARGEIEHQGRLREEVRRIDAHGRHRRAVNECSVWLETLRDKSPAALHAVRLKFRQGQLALAEKRTAGNATAIDTGSETGSGPAPERPEDAGQAALAFLPEKLGADPRLDRLASLRAELASGLAGEAGAWRTWRWAHDSIAREEASSTALEAAARVLEARRSISREVAALLADPRVNEAMPELASRMQAARLARLEADRDALAGELRSIGLRSIGAGGVRAPATRHTRALRSLDRVARSEGRPELSELLAAADASSASLWDRTIEARFARERSFESVIEGELAGEQGSLASGQALSSARRAASEEASRLEGLWETLVEKAGALPCRDGGLTVLERWREAEEADRSLAGYNRERAASDLARVIPVALRRLLGDDDAARRSLAALLLERYPASLPGAEGLSEVLEGADRACRDRAYVHQLEAFCAPPRRTAGDLKRLAERLGVPEIAEAFARAPREVEDLLSRPDEEPIQVSIAVEAFEKRLAKSTRGEGKARAELKAFLEDEAASRPARLLDWARAAGLKPPALREELDRLAEAQDRVAGREEAARLARLAGREARDELRSLRAWATAGREAEEMRREVAQELLPLEWQEVSRRGFRETRGRLLDLPGLVARDASRVRTAVENLSARHDALVLGRPVEMVEVAAFLDLQYQPKSAGSDAPSAAAGGRASSAGERRSAATGAGAHSRTFGDLDESYTGVQSLHAMAYLLLYQGGWDPRGLEKAERLLRPYQAYARARGGSPEGFHGLPKMFLASLGEETGAAPDAAASALAALAAELHASLTGSEEFLELAEEIAEKVLTPRFPEGKDLDPRLGPDGLREAALALAVFRNFEGIERTLARPARAEAFGRAAARLSEALERAWREDLGLYALGEPDADAHLLCLAVLAGDRRLSEARIRRAVRSLETRFGVRDDLQERYDSRSFRGNWFLNGPIEAYNQLVIPSWDRARERFRMPPLERVEPSDAWFLLNRVLHGLSGGHLGFSTEVHGVARGPRRERVSFASTALAGWVLHLLERRIEETSMEGNADDLAEQGRSYLRELAGSAVSDPRSPSSRGWPFLCGREELARDPRLHLLRGELALEPACYWVFARAAKARINAFLPSGFERLADLAARRPSSEREPDLGARAQKLDELIAAAEAEVARLDAAPASPATAAASATPAAPAAAIAAARWLEGEVEGSTGLIRALRDPGNLNACRTYPAALAIIHWSLVGKRGAHARSLESAVSLWRAMMRARGDRPAWLEAYDLRTGSPYRAPGSRATSHNAWMVLAGIHLSRAAGDPRILAEARETLDWVLGYQITDPSSAAFGAVTLGEAQPEAISTEANADALAAAWAFGSAAGEAGGAEGQRYREAASRIGKWLIDKVWLGDHFAVASRRSDGAPILEASWLTEWLDSQTWTVLALEATRAAHSSDAKKHAAALRWMAERYTVRVPYRESEIQGFAKVTFGPAAFWAEGVGGYVLAARAAGLTESPYRESLEAARSLDGTLPHILGKEETGDWRHHLPVPAIDGTVWAAWADPQVNFNPFQAESFGAPAAPGPAAGAAAAAAELSARRASARRTLDTLRKERDLLREARDLERRARELRR